MDEFHQRRLAVVAGVEKCATTSFYDWLSHSGNRSIPRYKETFYFTRNWSKGESWFRSLYDPNAVDLIFDITPSYFRNQAGLRRIAEAPFTSKKLLFFMRSQVARAFSFYCHDIIRHLSKGERFLKDFQVARSFSFYDLQDSDYYFTTYSDKLLTLGKVFGMENIMPIVFEDFVANPLQYVSKLEAFLNSDFSALGNTPFPKSNKSTLPYYLYSEAGCSVPINEHAVRVRPNTIQVFRDGAPAEVIAGKSRVSNALFCYGTWTLSLPKRHAEWMYRKYFAEDTTRLERITGLDLACWRVQSDYKAKQLRPGCKRE